MNQLFTQISIVPFGDAGTAHFVATTGLLRCSPKPNGKLATVLELTPIHDRIIDGGGIERAYPGNAE